MPETASDHTILAEAHAAKHKQDMSDGMMDHGDAKTMEADIRWRFFVALVLTLPVFLYSPLALSLLKLHPHPRRSTAGLADPTGPQQWKGE